MKLQNRNCRDQGHRLYNYEIAHERDGQVYHQEFAWFQKEFANFQGDQGEKCGYEVGEVAMHPEHPRLVVQVFCD